MFSQFENSSSDRVYQWVWTVSLVVGAILVGPTIFKKTLAYWDFTHNHLLDSWKVIQKKRISFHLVDCRGHMRTGRLADKTVTVLDTSTLHYQTMWNTISHGTLKQMATSTKDKIRVHSCQLGWMASIWHKLQDSMTQQFRLVMVWEYLLGQTGPLSSNYD